MWQQKSRLNFNFSDKVCFLLFHYSYHFSCAQQSLKPFSEGLFKSIFQHFVLPETVAIRHRYEQFCLKTWSDDAMFDTIISRHNETFDQLNHEGLELCLVCLCCACT